MYRCALLAFAATATCISAQAQMQRHFTKQTLRGELVVLQSPNATMNGKSVRLAPGARIRGTNNLLVQPVIVMGQELIVHYTVEPNGMLLDIWVLTPAELANKPWPETFEEAAKWSFNAATQTWTK